MVNYKVSSHAVPQTLTLVILIFSFHTKKTAQFKKKEKMGFQIFFAPLLDVFVLFCLGYLRYRDVGVSNW